MNERKCKYGAGVLVALLGATPALAVEPLRFTGSILGFVQDNNGVVQMGATVLLFNRYDRLLQRASTNAQGAFGFDALTPDLYSVRVNLASFVTATKQNISVQPGVRSILQIHLASVLSTIELTYSSPGVMMSDDWKWVLRTSSSTRPVLRLLPGIDVSEPTRNTRFAASVFSDTRGVVRVSAGDAGSFASSNLADLGTAFALATSVFGKNQVQVSGNFGYMMRSGAPAAGFRTSYSRGELAGSGPEVTLTMHQLYLPGRSGMSMLSGQTDGLPALRTMSVSFRDQLHVSDNLQLEYGGSMESVSFLDRLNYMSPFARVTYSAGKLGSLQLGYSSGAPPAELSSCDAEGEPTLHSNLDALALLPRVSLRQGRVRVERTQNIEVGVHKVVGRRTYALGAFHETVSNGALTAAASADMLPSGDLLPDISSRSSIFNVGHYSRLGYMASVRQTIGDSLELAVAYGRSGALTASQQPSDDASADGLRSQIHRAQRSWVSTSVTGTLPGSGTKLSSSYQWVDYNALMPAHIYLTQKQLPDGGWNVSVRQPIPNVPGMPGRLEASAELRNLLAEGYLPLSTSNGGRLLLINSPRAVRGGLSFIF